MVTKNVNALIAWCGLAAFALLIALAIFFESAYTLYAASVLPIIVVPFLPDIPASQWLKPSGKKSRVRIYRTSPNAEDPGAFVIIECAPGTIRWNCRKFYFSTEGIPVRHPSADASIKSVPVLAFDLIPHRRRKNSYAIRANHLIERMASLSVSPEDITRLVIRLEDLQRLRRADEPISGATAVNKGLQA